MKKPSKKDLPHIIMTTAAWLIFLVCLGRFLVAYGSLPEEIGVHFGGNGAFDVTDRKIFGFYPFVISLIALVLGGVFCLLVKKVSLGGKVTEKGERLMRSAVTLYIDISQLVTVLFFSGVWADCVIRQKPLDTGIPVFLLMVIFGLFPVLIVFLIAVKIICRKRT